METFGKLLILIILGATARGVYLGLTKKAVFYIDKEDLFLSFSAWIAIVVGYIIGGFLEWDWVISLGYLVSISIIIYNAKQTYIYNNNNINYAIPIGIAKTLLSLLFLVTLINAVPSDKRTFRGDSIALAIAGLFSVLLYKLINSEEINTELDYDKRLREWNKEDETTAGNELDYKAYFNEKLKKWKIKSPHKDLSETDKEKFYAEVDRDWHGVTEED